MRKERTIKLLTLSFILMFSLGLGACGGGSSSSSGSSGGSISGSGN